MKAILEFSFPEDSKDHQDAMNGTRWKKVAIDFDAQLRLIEKHGNDGEWATKYRRMLHGAMTNNGVDFD